MTLLDHAKEYARQGWPVFPVKPRDIEKKPLTLHGFQDATTDIPTIERWWKKWPDASIGMACGKQSGVFVIDVDVSDGKPGHESYRKMENSPTGMESRTGSGGSHLFFKYPEGREIRNRQGVAPGVDVRGEGGYVILPPSVHHTGNVYHWVMNNEASECRAGVIDMIAPLPTAAPWEQPRNGHAVKLPERPHSTSVIDRASLYLKEIDPAIQGSGGHDALMWAARCLITGFMLTDAEALSLLWNEYNPRCSPPWVYDNPKERKDFERKVDQVKSKPSKYPDGWLLDEFGFRSGESAMANIVGDKIADALMKKYSQGNQAAISGDNDVIETRDSFPIEHFPGKIQEYCRQVTLSHSVDASFAALPMLVAAGSAMGNAWRLKLKNGFFVPPHIWAGLVARSGENKSGPLNEVLKPLRKVIVDSEAPNPILNPQGRLLVSDATLEAVIHRLGNSPRGLLVFRDELAGWANSFNAYKKSGGDEQTWLEFWGGNPYQLDRKTNKEEVSIASAAVGVIGGIQPKLLAKCFDPEKFASGLVPRILVACPPRQNIQWREDEIDEAMAEEWDQSIHWLRTRPFSGMDSMSETYLPNVITLTQAAKKVYVQFFEEMSHMTSTLENEHAASFCSKARVQCARLILIHRGLLLSQEKPDKIDAPVTVESAEAGVAWMNWALSEQMRIYGFAEGQYHKQKVSNLALRLKRKYGDEEVAFRDVYRSNRLGTASEAEETLNKVVDAGLAEWIDDRKKLRIL